MSSMSGTGMYLSPHHPAVEAYVFVSDNCLGPIKKPVISSCCRSLLGCKDCCDQWFIGSSRCPQCSSDTGRDGRIDVCGLDDTCCCHSFQLTQMSQYS